MADQSDEVNGAELPTYWLKTKADWTNFRNLCARLNNAGPKLVARWEKVADKSENDPEKAKEKEAISK
jgi:hypothetical protein